MISTLVSFVAVLIALGLVVSGLVILLVLWRNRSRKRTDSGAFMTDSTSFPYGSSTDFSAQDSSGADTSGFEGGGGESGGAGASGSWDGGGSDGGSSSDSGGGGGGDS